MLRRRAAVLFANASACTMFCPPQPLDCASCRMAPREDTTFFAIPRVTVTRPAGVRPFFSSASFCGRPLLIKSFRKFFTSAIRRAESFVFSPSIGRMWRLRCWRYCRTVAPSRPSVSACLIHAAPASPIVGLVLAALCVPALILPSISIRRSCAAVALGKVSTNCLRRPFLGSTAIYRMIKASRFLPSAVVQVRFVTVAIAGDLPLSRTHPMS